MSAMTASKTIRLTVLTAARWAAAASTGRCGSGPRTGPGRAGAGRPGRRPAAPRGSPARSPAGTSADTRPATAGRLAPGSPDRSCRRPSRQVQPPQRDGGMSLQPGRLGGEPPGAGGREPVVPAKPPVHDLFPVPPDQLVFAEAVQGGVQGPRAQPELVAGDLLDVGDDPVPVLAAVGQRSEDHEGRFLHRTHGHTDVIYR